MRRILLTQIKYRYRCRRRLHAPETHS
jgi:hypothetical protein